MILEILRANHYGPPCTRNPTSINENSNANLVIGFVVFIGVVLICIVIHDIRLRKKFTNSDNWDEEVSETLEDAFTEHLEMKEVSELYHKLIPRNQIILKNIELGTGHFGKVHKGMP